MDDSYFNTPVQRSVYFRGLTVMMLLAVGVGVFTAIRDWSAFPVVIRFLVIVTLCAILTIWVRGILNHRRFRNLLAKTPPPDDAVKEMIRLSGTMHYYGQSRVFAVAMILFMALLITIGHLRNAPETQPTRTLATHAATTGKT